MRPAPALIPLLLFAAASLLAQAPAERPPFPDDYIRHPCASKAEGCVTFDRHEIYDVAAIRGFTIEKEWIDAHWDEMRSALAPFCARATACYSNPVNTWTWCNDVVGFSVHSLCEMYPEGSEDRRLCGMLSRVMWAGFDRLTKQRWLDVRACAKESAAPGERTLDVWMTPAAFDQSYQGQFILYALDGETRIPVKATVALEGQKLRAIDVPDGRPTAGLPIAWEVKWNRVPNAHGHRDIAPPVVSVRAEGYRTVTFPAPLVMPRLVVEMTPKVLKPGRNTVTVTARDAVTGQPAEMRVMAGTATAGRSNEPFVLDLPAGSQPPEIWITSLFDRYSDVVVLAAPR